MPIFNIRSFFAFTPHRGEWMMGAAIIKWSDDLNAMRAEVEAYVAIEWGVVVV
jgi:hypothetical protein